MSISYGLCDKFTHLLAENKENDASISSNETKILPFVKIHGLLGLVDMTVKKQGHVVDV